MSKFRKKPIVIEAHQLTPTNGDSVALWSGGRAWPDNAVTISTLEGEMTANPGDWIIKGVKGEFYPCRSDIFEATYEAAD